MAFEVRHFSPLIQRWRRCLGISTTLAAGAPNGWARHWLELTRGLWAGVWVESRSAGTAGERVGRSVV